MTFLTERKCNNFWIGANDIAITDDWVWEYDKSKLLFSDWHVGEPSKGEDCGEIKWDRSLYRWNNQICSSSNLYICQK